MTRLSCASDRLLLEIPGKEIVHLSCADMLAILKNCVSIIQIYSNQLKIGSIQRDERSLLISVYGQIITTPIDATLSVISGRKPSIELSSV